MNVEPRTKAGTSISATACVLNTAVAVLFCICSLLFVKIIALAINAAQLIVSKLRLTHRISRHSIVAALVGLMTTVAGIILSGFAVANTIGMNVLIGFAFCLGLVLTTTAASCEGARSGRVGLATDVSRPFETWFVTRMRHSDDAVWARLLFFLSVMIWPIFALIARPASFGLLTVLLYSAVMSVMSQAIMNFEHGDSHYHFFRTHCATSRLDGLMLRSIDLYVTYMLPLVLARVPHWYEVQHVVIHHAEDNGPNDTQSTLEYDRASFVDFARCAHRFAVSGLVSGDVIAYLRTNRRRKSLRSLGMGLFVFYAFIVALAFINWKCALALIIYRYISGILSATGFFQEHGIVDVSRPTNIYTNSLHFIAPENLHGSRGEDFHIAHHLRPGHHWVEYRSEVDAEIERYESEGAVGFMDGADHVAAYYRLLWKRDFLGLAKYFVTFGRRKLSAVEMAELLRRRTRPLSGRRDNSRLKVDLMLGRCAGYLLP
jgi:hypothetical protein